MKQWQAITHYAGFDWARDHHVVVIVDSAGHIVVDFEFQHSLEGWQAFAAKTTAWPHLAIAIETNEGAAVDQLLQRGYTVYPVNPVALRVDGHGWKPLQPMDPLTQKLRLLARDEANLIGQRTLLVNMLQQALVEYYPAALEAFDDWTARSRWEFILQFPTPQLLVEQGKRRWEKFLHTHKLWRPETTERRLSIFARADQFKASEPIAEAKSHLAVSLCKLLCTLEEQLAQYRRKVEAVFHAHPDHHLFGSLPGAKKVLAPRLLAAIGNDPSRYGDHQVLQCFAGTAPVNYQSGQIHKTHMRWACDKFLRATVHLWADCFRKRSAWGQTYYLKKREQGMSHACALRCLGQRLLKIVFRMLVDKKPYDAELHARNQQKHGSWVLTLAQKTTASAL